jgi:hypothetical protein
MSPRDAFLYTVLCMYWSGLRVQIFLGADRGVFVGLAANFSLAVSICVFAPVSYSQRHKTQTEKNAAVACGAVRPVGANPPQPSPRSTPIFSALTPPQPSSIESSTAPVSGGASPSRIQSSAAAGAACGPAAACWAAGPTRATPPQPAAPGPTFFWCFLPFR